MKVGKPYFVYSLYIRTFGLIDHKPCFINNTYIHTFGLVGQKPVVEYWKKTKHDSCDKTLIVVFKAIGVMCHIDVLV